MVVFPTSGLYGLAADAFNETAVRRLYHIKRRPENKPVLVLISSRTILPEITTEVPEAASRLMDRFWPGQLTILLTSRPAFPEALTAGTGRIGVRLPLHPVARALAAALNHPVTGTSANLSGSGGCSCIEDLDAALVRMADLVLDAGPLKGGPGSTVVDATCSPPAVLREGAISAETIFQSLGIPDPL